jgi:hypothetical protein
MVGRTYIYATECLFYVSLSNMPFMKTKMKKEIKKCFQKRIPKKNSKNEKGN